MSNYSLNLLTSLNELGLIITNVRSLANMDASKGPEETKRNRNIPVAKKRQQSGAHTQQQSKSSSGGQDNRRPGKDERGNSTRPTSQDLAKASYAGTSPFGVRQHRSTGNKAASTLGIKKKTKKILKHSLQPLDANPSTSMTHIEVMNEVDNEEDDMETFDIDCSPYNNVHEWNDDEHDEESDEREQRDGGQSRGGFNSFQSGRSRRTVSPYPYRLKLKKQNGGNKWAIDETYDRWDEGSFFDDGRGASSEPTGLDYGNSGGIEEKLQFSWHADDLMEDRLGDLNLQERYTAIDGDHDNNLKPCLKKKANSDDQRLVMNVSWNENENNEFDTATVDDNHDNEHKINDGCEKVEYNGQSCALVEERRDEIRAVEASMQPHTKADQSQDSMESRSFVIKTPENSQNEVDVQTEGCAGEMQNLPISCISDDVPGDTDANQCSEMDGQTKDGDSKGCSSMDTPKHPQSLVEEWTDDAISHLTDDEKYSLMKRQEHLEIARYDDPHLCRADRIKLLWEDCARKERLLHRLRPISTAIKSLDDKGSSLAPTNVNGYNHYNY